MYKRQVRPEITNLVEFKRQVKEKYWSETAQNKVRMDIFYGKYDASKGQSPTSYFLGKICLARKLIPPIPEECLVRQLAGHYSYGIKDAQLYQQLSKITDLAKLLENCESAGKFQDYQPPNRKVDYYNSNNGPNRNGSGNGNNFNPNNQNNSTPLNSRNNNNQGPNNRNHPGPNRNNYPENNYNRNYNQGNSCLLYTSRCV